MQLVTAKEIKELHGASKQQSEGTTKMDAFFNKSEDDQIAHVREETDDAGNHSPRRIEVTWTKLRYLIKATRVTLLEWHMRTDDAYEQWDLWKSSKQESVENGDHARAAACDAEIGAALRKIALCDDRRQWYRNQIRELSEMEEKISPHLE